MIFSFSFFISIAPSGKPLVGPVMDEGGKFKYCENYIFRDWAGTGIIIKGI